MEENKTTKMTRMPTNKTHLVHWGINIVNCKFMPLLKIRADSQFSYPKSPTSPTIKQLTISLFARRLNLFKKNRSSLN